MVPVFSTSIGARLTTASAACSPAAMLLYSIRARAGLIMVFCSSGSASYDAEGVLQRTAAQPAETDRIGEPLAGRAGDGERAETLAAVAGGGQRRPGLDADRTS